MLYANDTYELILVFCDTDKEPYREYAQIKKKINQFLSKTKASDKLIIFANPCTMQIILSHFGDVSLKNQEKKRMLPLSNNIPEFPTMMHTMIKSRTFANKYTNELTPI